MEMKKSVNSIRSIKNLDSVNHATNPPLSFSNSHQLRAIFEQMHHQQQLQHLHHHQQQQQQHPQQQQQQQQLQQQQQQQQQAQHQLQQQLQQLHQQQLQQNQIQQHQLQVQTYHNNIISTTANHHQLNQLQPSPRNSIIITNGNGNRHAITNGHNSINGNTNNISNNNSSNNHHTPKKELIDLVTCKLCKGYLVDAATLDLCMHSFCKPCAVKYIREKPMCPECNMAIKDKRYLNRLKTDVTMQNIVYKLVPGLYEREMERRRKFYLARPSHTPRYKSEMIGDIPPSKTIKPDDMLNVCINWNRDCQDEEPIKTYLYCRADSTMLVLRKLIVAKFGLDKPIKIYYGNSEIFFDLTTLMDVASTFNWAPESKILNLSFNEDEDKPRINSSHLTSSDHGPSSDLLKSPC